MSNLRWILLFTGVAILLLLYFTGRPKKVRRSQSERRGAGSMQGVSDPLMDHSSHNTDAGRQTTRPSMMDDFDATDFDVADMERPDGGYGYQSETRYTPQVRPREPVAQPAEYHTAESPHYTHDSVPGGQVNYPPSLVSDPMHDAGSATVHPIRRDSETPAETMQEQVDAGTSLGGKIDALSARLMGRKKPVENPVTTVEDNSEPQKVILLHVVAPDGQVIEGELLLHVFEQRRYHFGEKNIFHSLHNGEIVFSVAKMVEPGSFDVDDISSFETPGLVLILQLPGPVAGDVAFEVLVSEAHELADALGCRVLDSKRSTLSRQTTQHLRENIRNYMHRQKYLKKAVS